jgi:threonine dehydrogenase-like Zn-dependent dehydrogenase
MQAVMLLGPGRLSCEDIPLPTPGPEEVVLQVAAALTCGTDLKAFRRGHPKWPMPTRFGHEYAGTIAARGKLVASVRERDVMLAAHCALRRLFLLSTRTGNTMRLHHGNHGAGRIRGISDCASARDPHQSVPEACRLIIY